MTSKLSLSSRVCSSATLVAINSISAATVAADDNQNHHAAAVVAAVATDNPLKVVSVEKADITSALDNTEREDRLFTTKSSTAAMKPDVGILSKEFSTKGREQPIGKQFAIHRKKRAAAADVDVGILGNGRRQQQKAFDTNLHAINEVTLRSLQSEVLPDMCPGKYGYSGPNFSTLFYSGYFPKCSCPSPTTCGPVLCECLELDTDGDILQCMDPFNQLCEGTKYISGIPGPWSMEQCLGSKLLAISYCSMLPCFADGGSSYVQCRCNRYDRRCTEYRFPWYCAVSKCCQAQTNDEGREACFIGGDLYENYYDQVTSFSISVEEMISRFNECSFNSDSGKSIVECYCESFGYGRCVNNGVARPDYCEAMNCCFGGTNDDARLDCFTRFRDEFTGYDFRSARDTIQESCVVSGRSSDQCKCDVQGLSNCVGVGIIDLSFVYDKEGNLINWEQRCDLFQCCQSQTGDDDEGRKDCLVQDETQLLHEECIKIGRSTESCYCYKSSKLCSSGHSNYLHCELSSCCQEQSDDTGRKECIGNFTTSNPSSAPSEAPTEDSTMPGTSSASIPAPPLGAKSHAKTTSKMLAVTAAVIGWLLFTPT